MITVLKYILGATGHDKFAINEALSGGESKSETLVTHLHETILQYNFSIFSSLYKTYNAQLLF